MDFVAQYTKVFTAGGIVVGFLFLLLLWFIVKRLKVVENNEVLIIESLIGKRIRAVSGGASFVLPLIQKSYSKSLEPMELNIDLARVMTKGNIPLGGKIFAQVVVDHTEPNVFNVAKHLSLRTRAQQVDCCFEILNGVLRETVATLSPEQVLEDKETFKEEMLKNAVISLGHLGFKIKTLNIQEVSDQIKDNKGYISQLMRPRGYRVDKDTRMEVSQAESNKVLEQNEAHKQMRLTQIAQEMQSLTASMDLEIQKVVVEGDVNSKEIESELSAQYQEMLASLDTKKAELEASTTKYEADQIQKAIAIKEMLIEDGKAESASILQSGLAEVKVLEEQLSIIEKSGSTGVQSFLIDNYSQLSRIFTETMHTAKSKELHIIDGISNNESNNSSLFSAQNVATLLEILKNSGIDIAKFGTHCK